MEVSAKDIKRISNRLLYDHPMFHKNYSVSITIIFVRNLINYIIETKITKKNKRIMKIVEPKRET